MTNTKATSYLIWNLEELRDKIKKDERHTQLTRLSLVKNRRSMQGRRIGRLGRQECNDKWMKKERYKEQDEEVIKRGENWRR